MSKVLTSLEVSKKYNLDIPDWQHTANARFIEGVHLVLKLGGTWIYPNAQKILTKVEGGWEVVL